MVIKLAYDLLIGILKDVEVDIYGVKSIAKFEVIEINDDIEPYLALFGIDWDFDNLAILNKRREK